jgi:hypothetical protein
MHMGESDGIPYCMVFDKKFQVLDRHQATRLEDCRLGYRVSDEVLGG